VTIDDTDFEIFFPGEGHTDDNTVVWIKRYELLFAGCIVKEQGVTSLGNIGDANLKEWPNALNKLLERYEDIAIVVPGHGQWGDKTLIEYTLGLFEE
jgi:metallo-beta-lactamase class B